MKAFVRSNRICLSFLSFGSIALVLFYTLRSNRPCMNWWVQSVSMPCKKWLGYCTDLVPFSVCESGATVLILAVLILLLKAVVQSVRRHRNLWTKPVLRVITLLVCGYAAVCGLWGTQYYADGFDEKAGWNVPTVRTEDLVATLDYFVAQVNTAAENVQLEEDGNFTASETQIFQTSRGIYQNIEAKFSFLAGAEHKPKPAFYSKLMSAAGFTGYLCPLAGESTLNVDCPSVFLPVTICHEFAHQRGVAAEQEANFVGVLASIISDDPVYQYSGWLFGYLHLSNALYSVDPELANSRHAMLCEEAQASLRTNNQYWKQWEGKTKEAGEKVYTTFLESYGQEMGMKSYGACVDYLVYYYLFEGELET